MITVRELYDYFTEYLEIGGDMKTRINQKGLAEIFKPIAELYEDDYDFNKVFFYILFLYSRDSDSVICGLAWDETRSQVCRKMGFDEEADADLIFDLMEFTIPAINQTIRYWLGYQGSDIWSHLQVLRDCYSEMLIGAKHACKSDGNADYDQRRKCMQYAKDYYTEIKEWEQKYDDRFKDLRQGIGELNKKAPVKKTEVVRTLQYEGVLRQHNERVKELQQKKEEENEGI